SFVSERIKGRRILQEEIERIMNGHLGNEFDLDAEFAHFVWKDEARIPVREWILLPVDEVLPARDFLRVAENFCPAVRSRPQSNDVRAVVNGPVVRVMRFVVKGDVDGHGVIS